MAPPTYAFVSTFRPIKVLMVDFQTKSLNKKKVFVVRDKAPYFSEALGFNLLSLLVNPVVDVGYAAYASPQQPFSTVFWMNKIFYNFEPLYNNML